jgi:hypothetical protein
MKKYDNNICVICYINTKEKEIIYSECEHSYCIDCFSKIKKCAICRKILNKTKLFIELEQKIKSMNSVDLNLESNNSEMFAFLSMQSVQDSIQNYLDNNLFSSGLDPFLFLYTNRNYR